eukprot:6172532-Pleurochrysis_carterae.AAC.2
MEVFVCEFGGRGILRSRIPPRIPPRLSMCDERSPCKRLVQTAPKYKFWRLVSGVLVCIWVMPCPDLIALTSIYCWLAVILGHAVTFCECALATTVCITTEARVCRPAESECKARPSVPCHCCHGICVTM